MFDQEGATFPFGAHIAVVEVDTETGKVRLVRHVAVDDCGTVLNPLLVEGQQHGGIAAGVGQALFEEVRFDEDGNPITSNLADYAMPSAAELPSFEVHSTETPTPSTRWAQGHRRSGHDRLDAGGAERRDRRRGAPRCAPHRHAVHSRAGVAAIRDAEAGTLPDPWSEPPDVFARLRADAAAAAANAEDAAGAAAADGI